MLFLTLMGRRGGYSIDTLDKGVIHALGGMRLLRMVPNEKLMNSLFEISHFPVIVDQG